MAALNFPLSPNDGDVYGNYVYDATEGVWNANPRQLASRFVTSATQPSSPSNGDGWLDTNTGKTYIYYNDGTSAQWIESGNPVIGFVDPYDQDSTSTGYFSLPKGTSAQRPVAPSNGDIRFNTELGEPEYYSENANEWFPFREAPVTSFSSDFLIIAGGGGGSWDSGGGGGAGGYRTSAGTSGQASSAMSPLSLNTNEAYIIEVGGGGAAGNPGPAPNGSNSSFGLLSAAGGGGGGNGANGGSTVGSDGGSGGGGGFSGFAGGSGQLNQGFAGGSSTLTLRRGGGGGGAGSVGLTGSTDNNGGNGGNGLSSSITGSAVGRAGGGGGGGPTGGVAVDGGGTGGSDNVDGSPGVANTGGGGGAGRSAVESSYAAAGGSGVVIFSTPSSISASFSVGLVEANSGLGQPVGDSIVYTVTAGTGTVTIS